MLHARSAHTQQHTPAAVIAAIASRQNGLVTREQLRAAGLSDATITRAVARGLLHPVHRGVFLAGHASLSREARWHAAVLATNGALSRISAAQLHEISRFKAPPTVISPLQRRPEGVVVHRCRRLDPRDLTTHKGIPVTTVHRTLVDLSDELTPYQLANVIHEAAYHGRYVEAAVRDSMARANGRRNLHVLERAIELHDAGCPGTKSAGEDAFLTLGFPEPLVNMPVLGEEVDFHWPEQRLIVEIDGKGHGRRTTRLDDERRDRKLHAAGYSVLRLA